MTSIPDGQQSYAADDISDLFNMLPSLVGFSPEDSVVAVATEGAPSYRFGFRLRLDLPEHLEDAAEAAELIVYHLMNNEAEGAIVLALTDRQRVARETLLEIVDRLGPITPIAVARSNGERYWVDVPGFPTEGIPYKTSRSHLSIVTAVASGQQILPNRAALAERVAPPSAECVAEVNDLYTQVCGQIVDLVARSEPAVVEGAMADLAAVFLKVHTGTALGPEHAARLCVWLNHSEVADAIADQINDDNAADWLQALTHCSRQVPPDLSPSVAALTSYAAWRTGNGALALIAAERATDEDASHSLGRLMLDVLRAGVPPPRWLHERERRRTG